MSLDPIARLTTSSLRPTSLHMPRAVNNGGVQKMEVCAHEPQAPAQLHAEQRDDSPAPALPTRLCHFLQPACSSAGCRVPLSHDGHEPKLKLTGTMQCNSCIADVRLKQQSAENCEQYCSYPTPGTVRHHMPLPPTTLAGSAGVLCTDAARLGSRAPRGTGSPGPSCRRPPRHQQTLTRTRTACWPPDPPTSQRACSCSTTHTPPFVGLPDK